MKDSSTPPFDRALVVEIVFATLIALVVGMADFFSLLSIDIRWPNSLAVADQ